MQRAKLVMCFGGGGGFGFGFNRGVADGLIDAGIDVVNAPKTGTSAGAITAASLAAGLTFDAVADAWEAYNAATDKSWFVRVADLTEAVFADARPAGFEAPIESFSIRLPWHGRVAMDTDRFLVSDLVAASCSIPPVAKPHRIGSRYYVDGGLASNMSADLAPPADLLIVTNPLITPKAGLLMRANERRAAKELAAWTAGCGGEALLVAPNDEIGRVFSPKLSDIGDIGRGRAAYGPSVEYGHTIASELKRLYGDVPMLLST